MHKLLTTSIVIILFLCSCSKKQDNIIISKEFINQEWPRFEYLNGNIDIKNTDIKYDIVMEVIVSDIYPNEYENHQKDGSLSFNMSIDYPNGSSWRSRNYNYKLKDKEGNWKANRKDGYYSFKLPIISEMSFDEKGVYNFKLENKYSKDPLQGIKYLEIRCISSK